MGESPRQISAGEVLLLVSVFVVAACGLVYELVAGTLASYLLGDSVLQFSTIIGTYLFAMGVGSWLSRYMEHQLVAHFLRIELLVGLVGGLMPAGLFVAHSILPAGDVVPFRALLYGVVLLIGVLVGLEIPLVMRILKRQFSRQYVLKDLVSEVLTFDYLGALVVALAFPLLFLPTLGVVRTGAFFGLLNAAVAAWALVLFRPQLRAWRAHAVACVGVVVVLSATMVGAKPLTTWAEDRFYGEGVVLRQSTPYQRIVLTQSRSHTRLYLNGNLQFSSSDEYRYHEALVHPAMSAHGAPRRVLVLGGGDGMAVREILRYASVKQVVLVELDPAMTKLFSSEERLLELNGRSLKDPRVQVINTDAFTWLTQPVGSKAGDSFDVIVVDFPDPTNHAIGKLYSNSFYGLLDSHLSAGGYAVIQATSPLMARQSYWTVVNTLESVELSTTPYHAHVPSFGEWGFVLAHRRPWRMPTRLPQGLRFLTVAGLPALFDFPPDMSRVPTEINRLSNQSLVEVFAHEWGRVQQ